ncbi:MAG: deoxyribodipyrimidine photo-lyase [Bacteroidota bacterium]
MVDNRLIYKIKDGIEDKSGPVIYWMSRDQRVYDNEALLYAQQTALGRSLQLTVVFCLSPSYQGAALRQYHFMIEGLKEAEITLRTFNIPFVLLIGNPEDLIPDYISRSGASVLVTDFDPVRTKKLWKSRIAESITIPFYEVDTHNVIPCRYVSAKQEFAAYTIRPKINRLLPEFLQEIPRPEQMPDVPVYIDNHWNKVYDKIAADTSVRPVDWIKPGEEEALRMLEKFIELRLVSYPLRNDPLKDAQSDLSPYIHFGQISAKRILLNLENHIHSGRTDDITAAAAGFQEELVVRRELAENFCFYNISYDSFDGLPEWGKKTLTKHLKDKREHIYATEEFESARTHDPLWNAAQREMLLKGKMHGYVRMYWAKKILEWSDSPQQAISTAIYLNDKYELDGRDPNGYAGILWSVGGLHDRPWAERPVFGQVRYMNYNGCRRKFDVEKYIGQVLNSEF